MKAKLITFEGIDGSGKTALSKLLHTRLKNDHETHYVHEFCDEYVDGYIQNLLSLDPYLKLKPDLYSAWGQTLLFASAYMYKYETVIEPRLQNQAVLLVDRLGDSVFAFQSLLLERWNDISRDEAEAWIAQLLSPLPTPHLTFFLSARIEDLHVRWRNRGTTYTEEYQRYLEEVEARYESQLSKHPQRVVKLDAALSLEENVKIAEKHVLKIINRTQ